MVREREWASLTTSEPTASASFPFGAVNRRPKEKGSLCSESTEYETYLAEQSEVVTHAVKPRIGIAHSYINLNARK